MNTIQTFALIGIIYFGSVLVINKWHEYCKGNDWIIFRILLQRGIISEKEFEDITNEEVNGMITFTPILNTIYAISITLFITLTNFYDDL